MHESCSVCIEKYCQYRGEGSPNTGCSNFVSIEEIKAIPEKLWQEKRIEELSKAIYNYSLYGFLKEDYLSDVELWCREIIRIVEKIRILEQPLMAGGIIDEGLV